MMSEEKLLEDYKKVFYKKIYLNLLSGRNVIDIGSGDGQDAYNISKISKNVIAFDITRSNDWDRYKVKNLKFLVADAQNIPFGKETFSGVFIKDVLHHVENPERVLNEIYRISKDGAVIIIVEGNRYNPLLYIHMTKMLGHEHLTKSQFKKLIKNRFKIVKFYSFESHFYPNEFIQKILNIFSSFMEKTPILNSLLSYNVAVIMK